MPFYYLARWIGTGTENNPYRPNGADVEAGFACINLRPDSTVADGWSILRNPVALNETVNRVALTDDPDDLDATSSIRTKLENRLGINLDNTARFRRLVLRVLLEFGDDSNPNRWNRLKPERDGRYRVRLGGIIDELPVVSGGATYSDNFNRANSTTITAGGTIPWTEVSQNVEIVSNVIQVVTASGTSNRVRYDADLATADMYSQVRGVNYSFANVNNKRVEAAARFSPSVGTFYSVGRNFTNNAATATLSQFETVSGAVSTNASKTLTATANEVIRIEVNGSSLRAFVDGVEHVDLAVTDTTITGNLRAGFAIISGSTSASAVAIDDWEAGDLTGTAYTQTNTGTVTSAATAVKDVSKLTAGTVTPAGAAAKAVTQATAGTVAPSGALTTVKVVLLALAGNVNSAGSAVRAVTKAIIGAVAPTGAVAKASTKSFAGGLTPAGTLASVKVVLQTLTGVVASAGAIVRLVGKGTAGAVSPSGSDSNASSRTVSGTVTPTGAARKSASKTVAGAVTSSGGLARLVSRVLAGVLTPAGSVVTSGGSGPAVAEPGYAVPTVTAASSTAAVALTGSATVTAATGSSTSSVSGGDY